MSYDIIADFLATARPTVTLDTGAAQESADEPIYLWDPVEEHRRCQPREGRQLIHPRPQARPASKLAASVEIRTASGTLSVVQRILAHATGPGYAAAIPAGPETARGAGRYVDHTLRREVSDR